MGVTEGNDMDEADVWRVVDDERSSLADLFDDLTTREWETPSLCTGWRVREVAAHVTLTPMTLPGALVGLGRSRGDFNRMVYDNAVRQARLPVDRYGDLLRGMIGARRTAPVVTHVEKLIDILVHGQDITVPLGRTRVMPTAAAAVAVERIWPDRWPFRPARKVAGVRLVATDHSWSAGEGPVAEGPIGSILLLLTGRQAGLAQMAGPGVARLTARFGPSAASGTPGR
jgi:uncharacterized protein (TIGR03083 family)